MRGSMLLVATHILLPTVVINLYLYLKQQRNFVTFFLKFFLRLRYSSTEYGVNYNFIVYVLTRIKDK